MCKKGKCCNPLVISIFLISVGVALALLSIGALPLYQYVVKKELVMKTGATSFEDWNVAPLPVYMNYYIFNFTNVDDILNNHSKPYLEKLGPYAYRERRVNSILEKDSDEITYVQNYTYHFDEAASCAGCSESDTFFTPNTPYLTVLALLASANVTEHSPKVDKGVIQFFESIFSAAKVTMFSQHNVSELLWGYTDPFLVELKSLGQAAEQFLKQLNLTMPDISEFVALQHNGTDEVKFFGNFTLLTGNQDINDIQRITHWKGEEEVPVWLTKYGRMINGTDGTRFKPFLDKSDLLYSFIPDICRSVYLEYDKDDSIQDIDLYRFTTPDRLFANSSVNPDNKAYCLGGCWPTGVIPIGQCIAGNPPAYASGPHFYQSDPALFDAIDGLERPDKENHATLIGIEPDTGTTMKANKRLQINMFAKKIPLLPDTNVFPKKGIFLPVFYVDESVRLDKKNADKFKDEVAKPKKDLMVYGKYSLIGVGGAFVLIGIVVISVFFFKRSDEDSGKQYGKMN